MSTKIHQKMFTKIHQKCPREFTYFVKCGVSKNLEAKFAQKYQTTQKLWTS